MIREKLSATFLCPFLDCLPYFMQRGIKIKNIYWEVFYENTKNDQTAVNGKLNYKLRIIHYKKPPARANGTYGAKRNKYSELYLSQIRRDSLKFCSPFACKRGACIFTVDCCMLGSLLAWLRRSDCRLIAHLFLRVFIFLSLIHTERGGHWYPKKGAKKPLTALRVSPTLTVFSNFALLYGG